MLLIKPPTGAVFLYCRLPHQAFQHGLECGIYFIAKSIEGTVSLWDALNSVAQWIGNGFRLCSENSCVRVQM